MCHIVNQPALKRLKNLSNEKHNLQKKCSRREEIIKKIKSHFAMDEQDIDISEETRADLKEIMQYVKENAFDGDCKILHKSFKDVLTGLDALSDIDMGETLSELLEFIREQLSIHISEEFSSKRKRVKMSNRLINLSMSVMVRSKSTKKIVEEIIK